MLNNILFIVVLTIINTPWILSFPCTWTFGDKTFDLDPLTKHQGEPDWSWNDGDNWLIKWNYCATTVESGSCMVYSPAWYSVSSTQCISLGTIGSTAFNLIDNDNPSKGITIGYRTSIKCPDGVNYKGIDLQTECDLDEDGLHIGEVTPSSDCLTIVKTKSKYGCYNGYTEDGEPKVGGLSIGSWFMIMITVMITLYCASGMIYNSQFRKLSGTDIIPNKELIKELPGLVRDGLKFVWFKITKQTASGSQSYNQL